MFKFLAIVGLAALITSCGKQEEQIGPKGVGSRVTLNNSSPFEKAEAKLLLDTCKILDAKEKYFETTYAGKDMVFEFESQYQGCEDNYITEYATGAKVIFDNGQMRFQSVTPNAKIFSSIILRESGLLKDFCDKSQAKAMDKRYLQNGNMARWVYLTVKEQRLLVAVETGVDTGQTGEYAIETTDKMLISKQGFVTLRSLTTKVGCGLNQSSELTSNLLRIRQE